EGVVEDIPPQVLPPLKQFLKTLAQHGAELRLAFHHGPAVALSIDELRAAAERLERDVEQVQVEIGGIFRGVTLDSGEFDFRTSADEVISGEVADDFPADELEQLHSLTNKPCILKLE